MTRRIHKGLEIRARGRRKGAGIGGLGDDGSDEEWTPTCTDMVSVSCF